MANTDESTASPAPEGPVELKTTVQMGMDWDTGMVSVQAVTELEGGAKAATTIQIPADAFVQAGVSIGVQMVQKINAEAKAKKGGRIISVAPGQIPGDLRTKH